MVQHQGEQGLYRQQATGHSQRECFAQCPGRHLACWRSPINICRNEVCVQPETEAREGKQSLLLPQSQGFFVANRVTSDLKVPSSHCEESAAETNYHKVQRKAEVPTHQERGRDDGELAGLEKLRQEKRGEASSSISSHLVWK